MKVWDEKDIDIHLFEYLEGELTSKQTKVLEQKLASDASLQSELEHWKESFIEQAYYDTKVLEESLYRDKVTTTASSSVTSVFIFALVTSLFSFLPISIKKETTSLSLPVEIIESSIITDKTIVSSLEKSEIQVSKPVRQNQQNLRILQLESNENLQIELPEKIIPKEIPNIQTLSLTVNQNLDISIPEVDISRIKVKKMPAIRTITRKQQRQIAKMKERALQKRRSNEFLKGNTPYVVPLDKRNF